MDKKKVAEFIEEVKALCLKHNDCRKCPLGNENHDCYLMDCINTYECPAGFDVLPLEE